MTTQTEPPVDYGLWKALAWCGLVFMTVFVFLWGILSGNIPPFSPDANAAAVKQHYIENRIPILIGMSVCLTVTSCYMAWSCAISQVMRRVEGRYPLLSNLEVMGGTITAAPIMVACGIWLTAAHESLILPAESLHMMYWLGWLIIDLQYCCTTLQMVAFALAVLSDRKSRDAGTPLMPNWACYLTIFCGVSFFPASLTGVVKTGPFAWNGVMSYYFPYFCWLCWETIASTYMIRDVRRRMKEAERADASSLPVAEPVGS